MQACSIGQQTLPSVQTPPMHAEPSAQPPPAPPALKPVELDADVAPPAELVDPSVVEPLPEEEDVTASSHAARRKKPKASERRRKFIGRFSFLPHAGGG